MAYTTSCSALSDLNGTCEIDSTTNEITSYTSNNTLLGAATDIDNLPNPQPHAKITFTNSSTGKKVKYKVKGTANGNDFDGSAEEDDGAKKENFGDYDDPWTATAITVQPAAAGKGY